jgi:hypothetical protein
MNCDPEALKVLHLYNVYWAEQLGKVSFHAYQASARGVELFCEFRPDIGGDRVIMSGYVARYLKGSIEC